MKWINTLGEYCLFLKAIFANPGRWKIFRKRFVDELQYIGIDSLLIISIIATFTGAIAVIQVAFNLETVWIPKSLIAFTARQALILEFCPMILSLILAGKVGSLIASEIGTMRITEQIDALDVMGINSAAFLVLPKVLASLFFFPVLIILSIGFGLVGGYFIALTTNLLTVSDYITGMQMEFDSYSITYTLIKTLFFAFIITSISSFYGYRVRGGAVEVGQASTKAVVNSSIFVIIFDLILTQILLA
jgi:phospholipid/cholesterol/gamma-HCH transport system permease protein